MRQQCRHFPSQKIDITRPWHRLHERHGAFCAARADPELKMMPVVVLAPPIRTQPQAGSSLTLLGISQAYYFLKIWRSYGKPP